MIVVFLNIFTFRSKTKCFSFSFFFSFFGCCYQIHFLYRLLRNSFISLLKILIKWTSQSASQPLYLPDCCNTYKQFQWTSFSPETVFFFFLLNFSSQKRFFFHNFTRINKKHQQQQKKFHLQFRFENLHTFIDTLKTGEKKTYQRKKSE